MKLGFIIIMLFLAAQSILAQDGFVFPPNKKKIVIPFELVNNLIIIPIEVNGVSLKFLVDTGVEESILFSLDETDEISFAKIEKIKIRGFGKKEPFDGYKSINNTLNLKGYTDVNHTLYLVLDQDINISSQIGIPVNGIIGYHFFKNNLVKIDYTSKKITIYKTKVKQLKKISTDFTAIDLLLSKGKPYLIANPILENQPQNFKGKLVLDTGSADALWIFKSNIENFKLPQLTIDDFLGKGFSGEVYGKRARMPVLHIDQFAIQNPIVAYPDSLDTKDLENEFKRIGSIGSEVLRRFTVFFDYEATKVYLKKNAFFDDPFLFNMSGLEVQHQGLQWTTESFEANAAIANNLFDANGNRINGNLQYKFELKPVYIIANVRAGSPAALAGLNKGDVLTKINRNKAYSYSLQELIDLLKEEDGKPIEVEIERKGIPYTFKFKLKRLL